MIDAPTVKRRCICQELTRLLCHRLFLMQHVLVSRCGCGDRPRAPHIAKVVQPEDIREKTGLTYLHSSHCLGSGKP